jgi:AbrB family looped-hinge helix DNA binding protein
MLTSTITVKGQVTIPVSLRKRMGLREGDRVEFAQEEDGRVVIRRVENRAESAFGLLKARKPVTLEAMEAAIRARAGR